MYQSIPSVTILPLAPPSPPFPPPRQIFKNLAKPSKFFLSNLHPQTSLGPIISINFPLFPTFKISVTRISTNSYEEQYLSIENM